MRPLMVIAAAALVAFLLGCVSPRASQPHMQAALNALNEAATELQVAEHNKSGHRATAMHLVGEAISEVRAGIASAER